MCVRAVPARTRCLWRTGRVPGARKHRKRPQALQARESTGSTPRTASITNAASSASAASSANAASTACAASSANAASTACATGATSTASGGTGKDVKAIVTHDQGGGGKDVIT